MPSTNLSCSTQYDVSRIYKFLLEIFLKERIVINTFLLKELKKKFGLNRYQCYRIINKLVSLNVIKKTMIDKRTYELSLQNHSKLIDLIMCEPARNSRSPISQIENEPTRGELLAHARQLLKPRFHKANQYHREALNKYSLFTKFNEIDKKEVNALFELYLSDVSKKILWFKDPNGDDYFASYKTRYTSKSQAIEIIKKVENAFKTAMQITNTGVFLTLTVPPIFPQRLALWILSFLLHRIKAFCRSKFKQKVIHFKAIEPQEQWTPHFHVVIFNVDFLMWKDDLTLYLEKHLVNFLNNLGRHYKATINKRANDYDVLALNELGQIYVKKYNKYKKQKPKYTGPINWITRIYSKEGTYHFENPPPDKKPDKKEIKTLHDGGEITVFDYIKFYIIKNVQNASELAEMEIKKNKKVYLAWYWLNRLPFFTCSPILRTTHPPKPQSNFVFIRSITKEEYDYLRVEVIVKCPY